MKRTLISSVTFLVAIGFFASCANSGRETMTTTTETAAPVKKETTTIKTSTN